jgi:hypothetical protein
MLVCLCVLCPVIPYFTCTVRVQIVLLLQYVSYRWALLVINCKKLYSYVIMHMLLLGNRVLLRSCQGQASAQLADPLTALCQYELIHDVLDFAQVGLHGFQLLAVAIGIDIRCGDELLDHHGGLLDLPYAREISACSKCHSDAPDLSGEVAQTADILCTRSQAQRLARGDGGMCSPMQQQLALGPLFESIAQ